MDIILLGPPAAGKGTLSQWLIRDFNSIHASTGDMLRAAVQSGSELGKTAKPLMDAGKLVPDDIVNGIIQEWLQGVPRDRGIIFDGFPRTVAQAEALDGMMASVGRRIDVVISIQVTEQIVVDRIGGRVSCPKDGSVYHTINYPPKVAGKCDKCGADLIQRDDDKPDKIIERYKQYLSKTTPLADYYSKKGVFFSVDGRGGSEDVYAAVVQMLKTPR